MSKKILFLFFILSLVYSYSHAALSARADTIPLSNIKLDTIRPKLEHLSNKNPISGLMAGDKIMAGDFEIELLEVQGNGGQFSGRGAMRVPYFKLAKLNVVFNNIKVNTDKRLIDGYFQVVVDWENGSILNTTEAVKALGKLIGKLFELFEKTKEKVNNSKTPAESKSIVESTFKAVDKDVDDLINTITDNPEERKKLKEEYNDRVNKTLLASNENAGENFRAETNKGLENITEYVKELELKSVNRNFAWCISETDAQKLKGKSFKFQGLKEVQKLQKNSYPISFNIDEVYSFIHNGKEYKPTSAQDFRSTNNDVYIFEKATETKVIKGKQKNAKKPNETIEIGGVNYDCYQCQINTKTGETNRTGLGDSKGNFNDKPFDCKKEMPELVDWIALNSKVTYLDLVYSMASKSKQYIDNDFKITFYEVKSNLTNYQYAFLVELKKESDIKAARTNIFEIRIDANHRVENRMLDCEILKDNCTPQKTKLFYGETSGDKFVKNFPILLASGAAIGAGIYYILPSIALSAEAFTVQEAVKKSVNCGLNFTLDALIQASIIKCVKIYDKSNGGAKDTKVYSNEISWASAEASCLTATIQGCDAKCMTALVGVAGTIDDIYRQKTVEKKTDIDIERAIKQGVFQGMVALVAQKTITFSVSYLTEKYTASKLAKVFDDIEKNPQKYLDEVEGKVTGSGYILEKYRVAILEKVKIITKDESLPQFIKESFLDNYYYTAETIENVGVFRRFGGSANQAKLFGGFSSTEAVLGRNELAILKKWSTMQFEAELIVEKGAKLNLGKIAPQSVYYGGADQVLLPLGYPENWVKSIKDLKTGTVYTLEEFKIAFSDQIK